MSPESRLPSHRSSSSSSAGSARSARPPRGGRLRGRGAKVLATGAVLAVVAAGLGLAATTAATAAASDTQVVSENPLKNTPNALDGKVWAIKRVGNVVVVGGTFTQVQAAAAGSPILSLPNLFAFDATTGAILWGANVSPNAEVRSIVPNAAGTAVYVSGAFSTIGGVKASRVVLLDAATGNRLSFKASGINSEVYESRLVGSRLVIGGSFTSVSGQPRSGLAALDATTGALSTYSMPDVTGTAWGKGVMTVRHLDVSRNGTKLVAIGNFDTVGGQPRSQIAVLDLGTSGATVSGWSTTSYPGKDSAGNSWCSSSFDSYMRDVAFSPDGSYFVVATTGAFRAGKLCDSIARWETDRTGAQSATWIDWTGGDTTWSVGVSGAAVYAGGHMRWFNNPYSADSAGPGAVPREGMGALDPRNGLPLTWNPGRTRGVGLFDWDMTGTEVWAGSDTDRWNNIYHGRLAGFPYAGGTTLPADKTATLPADVLLLKSASQQTLSFDGTSVLGTSSSAPADDWSQARGAVMIDGTVYTGWADGTFRSRSYDGTSFGAAQSMELYNNGFTTNTSSYTLFSTEIPRITGMFYDSAKGRLYYTLKPDSSNKNGGFFYRYFTPQSGVIGAQRFAAAGGSLMGANATGTTTPQGMFLAGGKVYYADSSGALRRLDFAPGVDGAAGGVTGTSTLVDSSRDWRSNAMFASTVASGTGPNQPPVAAVSGSCTGLTCTFDASASSDPDGSVASYAFTFGDGTSAAASSSSKVTHTYATAGTYTAKVTVTDNRGGTDTASTSVSPQPVASSVTFRVAGQYSGGTTATHTFTIPAGVKAGDQMVMFVTGGLANTLTVPAGWTQADNLLDTDIRTVVLTRVATAADPGSTVSLVWSGGTRTMVSLAAYAGVGSVQVTGAVETSGTSITAHTTPGVTVSTAGSWVASYWADKNASTTTWTPPAGQVVRAQPPVTVSAGTTRVSALLTDDGQASPTGSRAGLTATANGTANKATMFTVVLVPA